MVKITRVAHAAVGRRDALRILAGTAAGLALAATIAPRRLSPAEVDHLADQAFRLGAESFRARLRVYRHSREAGAMVRGFVAAWDAMADDIRARYPQDADAILDRASGRFGELIERINAELDAATA